MLSFESTLEAIMQLDYTSREMILEILQKRIVEERREDIAKNAEKTLREYQSGKLKSLSFEETIQRLNSL